MSALRGSLTYTRFFVDGDVPDDVHDRFFKAVRRNVIAPLEPDDDVTERVGWCKMGEPFELDLAYDDVFTSDYLRLGFRTDRWAIPAALVRAKLREAEADLLAKKGRERLSRTEKKELKELVEKRLRRQSAPATRAVDLTWSLDDGLVRFFSQTPKQTGLVSDLFTRTFGLKIVPESPYTLAARLGLGRAEEAAWQSAEAIELGEGA